VAATGGGIVLDQQNRRMLRKHFFTVWLKAEPLIILARLNADPGSPQTRPPLSELPIKEEIAKVLSEREPLYSQTADFQVDTGAKQAVRIAQEIVEAVNKWRATDGNRTTED
jgi:shikimate kinase